MKLTFLAIALGQIASASLFERQAACATDGCLRAVEATSRSSIAKADCSSFMTATFTEEFTTVTTVTATETVTETKGKGAAVKPFGKRFPVPQASASPTVTPKTIPTYASACAGPLKYSSACSCYGFTATTETIAGFTTKTKYVTETKTVTKSPLAITTTASPLYYGYGPQSSYVPGNSISWSVKPGYNYSLPHGTYGPTGTGSSYPHGTSYSYGTSYSHGTSYSRHTSTSSSSSSSTSFPPTSSSSLSTSSTTSTSSTPTCTPSVCGFYRQCNFSGAAGPNPCICASDSTGKGVCVDRRVSCLGLRDCRRGCGLGEHCLVDTCCGRPVCVSALVCPAPAAGLVPRVAEAKSGPGRRRWAEASLGDVAGWEEGFRAGM